MELFDCLLKQYGYNEPIFTQEISYGDYSKPWLFKQLDLLCKDGRLIRYDKGIYYIPKATRLGKTMLDPRKVVRKKYIQSGDSTIGYYSGNTLLNLLRFTTQVPNAIEVCTNNEHSKIRKIMVGNQRVVLRRTRTPVTKDNAAVLQFLELMTLTRSSSFDEERRELVNRYIKEKNITRELIAAYAPTFPDRTMRNLIESGVIYHVTS